MARICPVCSTEMRVEEVDKVKLDVCPNCGAVWLDSGELRTLLTQDPLALSKLEDMVQLEDLTQIKIEQQPVGPSLRHCPGCGMPLQEYHYLYNSPIVLDVCPECEGLLVEEGEMGKMQQWLDESHAPMTKEEADRLALTKYEIAHDSEMEHQSNIKSFFEVLRRFRPGWIGLLP